MDNFDDVLVVDADGHVYEGNVDLASRMPEKWRSQAPVRLKDNEGNSRILFEGRLWSASQGLGPGVSGPMTDKARGLPRRHGRSTRPTQGHGRRRHRRCGSFRHADRAHRQRLDEQRTGRRALPGSQ